MPLLLGRVLSRVKSCFMEALPTPSASDHRTPADGGAWLPSSSTRGFGTGGSAESEVTPITVGEVLESTVAMQGIRPAGLSALLKPARNSPGFWYQCTVIAVHDNAKVRVRFKSLNRDPAWESDVNRALIRHRRHPDATAPEAPDLPAGTLVEVQMPDRWKATGEPELWSWWPGSVQVYSRRPNISGQVTVALDLSPDCTEHQVAVPRSRLRVVLSAGVRVRVEGAGVPGVDGIYEAVGFHDGVPRFECNNMALLRHGLPSGSRFWYIADKSQVEVDDGDFYRIRSPLELPPASAAAGGRWMCAKDGVEPIPNISWVHPNEPSHYVRNPHIQCPICARTFEQGEQSNEAINTHIDLCLSRAQPPSSEPPSPAADMPSTTPAAIEAPCDSASFSNLHSSAGAPHPAIAEVQQGEPAATVLAKNCVVCLDSQADCALIPCGHLCLCEGCAYSLRDRTPSCPMCRQPSIFMQRIFM
mmetsp:Transcript_17088/g.47689  ORF Transcript_17088/g.47689 Transcript_17088/m.47689 type:complete len:473 (-) Transcript_17088:215-1633(-)